MEKNGSLFPVPLYSGEQWEDNLIPFPSYVESSSIPPTQN